MANELKIRVVFDTGQAKPKVDELGASFNQFAGRISGVPAALDQVAPAMQRVQKGSANAAMTLQALNYTVRDSPYFFRDFSLGVLAVGNNLNPLIDGFIRMKQEAGGVKEAFKTLGGMLTGAQGVIFLFSMLVTVLQAVTFAMAKNKSATKEAADEFERFLKMPFQELESIKEINLVKMYREELKVLDLINDRRKKIGQEPFATLAVGGKALDGYDFMERYGHFFSDEYKQMRLINDEIDKRKGSMGRIIQLQNDIMSLEKQQAAAMTDSLAKSFNPMIEAKRKQLDDLLGRDKVPSQKIEEWDRAKFIEELLKSQGLEPQLINDIIAEDKKIIQADVDAYYKGLEDKAKAEIKWNQTVAQMATDAMAEGLDKKLAVIEDKYQKLFDALDKDRDIIGEAEYIAKRAGLEISKDKEIDKEKRKRKQELNEIEGGLNTIQTLSNDVGNALIQAFSNGANFVDSFIRSLEAAIAKMLVMLAIEQLIGLIFSGVTLTAPKLPGLSGGSFLTGTGLKDIPNFSTIGGSSGFPNIGMQKSLQAINMNMQSQQPTILIKAEVPGLKFTKEIVNPSQAKLMKGNVRSVL